MEAGLFALIEPGDKVLVPTYGRFAYLLGEICERARAEVIYLEKDWLAPFEQTTVIEAIKEHQPKLLRWSMAKRRMHKCNHWIKLALLSGK